ncbi:hypothetical protein IMSAGC003_00570 [Lachnospiraceae bacterium]|uniref:Secreted protein n=1 Tax=Acetatifactor muris TaxID=879566 RepID=A0A2K4ZP92_9FIRM|nr:hypothetical protein [Acetatifactor muris]MCR2050803.1 hypothetical protein [Acetatifactor muris]GFH94040.1 hypothetical protein IMSAGC003_00570 [Lachnospiraceae bacterium]SOY32291.1 hypothetical protein AMURIS_05049 [Acetatifactor muris]
MKNVIKKFTKVALVFTFVFACTATAYAYNTKFSFDLTSGMFSPWKYSSEAYKYSADENPVVECTYVEPSDATFTYDIVNSNDESRVVAFSAEGTFATREFERNTTVQNKKYRLRVKRDSGAWNSSANTQGTWNIDSY